MSKRAEEKALEVYPLYFGKHYSPRDVYQVAYEQAEKDTTERAIEWMKSNLLLGWRWREKLNAFKKAMEEEQ